MDASIGLLVIVKVALLLVTTLVVQVQHWCSQFIYVSGQFTVEQNDL